MSCDLNANLSMVNSQIFNVNLLVFFFNFPFSLYYSIFFSLRMLIRDNFDKEWRSSNNEMHEKKKCDA